MGFYFFYIIVMNEGKQPPLFKMVFYSSSLTSRRRTFTSRMYLKCPCKFSFGNAKRTTVGYTFLGLQSFFYSIFVRPEWGCISFKNLDRVEKVSEKSVICHHLFICEARWKPSGLRWVDEGPAVCTALSHWTAIWIFFHFQFFISDLPNLFWPKFKFVCFLT